VCPADQTHPPDDRDGPWERVLSSAALKPGALAKVHVAGRPVLLARLEDGTVAAASTVCPHRGEDLYGGRIYMGTIDCPLHHYLYDLRTGVNRYPRNVFPADLAARLEPLPLYPVKEEGGWIWVGARGCSRDPNPTAD
jgi:nitrite reductase/ring-hydroxylating ferredoxin subunit